MVLMFAAVCFVSWKKFTGQRKEIVSIADRPAQKELQQTSAPSNQKPTAKFALIVVQSPASKVPANAILVFAPTNEEEKFLQEFDPKLFQISGMEDFIRDRLWLAFDQLNNPLIQKLGLTDDEISKFKNLAVSNLVTATEQGSTATGQSSMATESAIDNALASQQGSFDAQLHQLLGDARFAQYENGIEDYSQFFGIKFLDGNSPPLPNGQVEQIISVMQSERQTVSAAAAQIQTQETADDQLQMRELIVGRAYNRLQDFLSPEQLTAFGQFELQQLDLFRSKTFSAGTENSSQGQ